MSKTCSFEGCEHKLYCRGLCRTHYEQLRRGEELRPLRKRTSPKEAERLRAQGLKKCFHCDQIKPFEEFAKDKRNSDGRDPRCRACQAEYYTCSFEGCDNPINAKGLCSSHYGQLRRGEELRPLRKRTSPKEAERLRAHGLRKCTECGQIKPLEEFAKDKRNSDGRDSRCKACHAESTRLWRRANREKRREYNRQYREANRERIREYHRQWRQKNPDKVRAHAARRRALAVEDLAER